MKCIDGEELSELIFLAETAVAVALIGGAPFHMKPCYLVSDM